MREKDGARVATAEHPATPGVAPRFTRAAQAERSRLERKREQLLRQREAAQAEVAEIDRAVGGVDELLAARTAARRQRQRTPGGGWRGRYPGDRARRIGLGPRGRRSRSRPAASPTTTSEGVRTSEYTQRASHAPALAVRRRRGADGRRRRDRRHGPAGAAERARADLRQRKLSHALYMAAEGLALCGAELHEVTEEARRGHGHGLWLREGER